MKPTEPLLEFECKLCPPEALESRIAQLPRPLVFTNGCFDILHRGHMLFLSLAKAQGEVLIVLLESDSSLRQKKGEDRPVHHQEMRAKILAALPSIDYILLLPDGFRNQDYDGVVLNVKPAIIATTKGDPGRNHKERQGVLTGATVIDVIDRLPNYASSQLAGKIQDL